MVKNPFSKKNKEMPLKDALVEVARKVNEDNGFQQAEQPAKREPRIVLINYTTAQRLRDSGEWDDQPVPDAPQAVCSIVGFLVKSTPSAFYVAKQSWNSGKCEDVHVIPRACIVNRRVLEWKK